MIKSVGNFNINFKGAPDFSESIQFDDIDAIFRKRDEQKRLEQLDEQRRQIEARRRHAQNQSKTRKRTNTHGDSFEAVAASKPQEQHTPARHRRKKAKVRLAPLLLTGSLIAGGFGIGGAIANRDARPENPSIQIQESTEGALPQLSEEEIQQMILEQQEAAQQERIAQRQEEVKEASAAIASDPQLRQVYSDMLYTIQRMENTLGRNPVELLQEFLKEPWAQNVQMELILPQIFFESSGYHYKENGEVRVSDANCYGYMQISEGAQGDLNAKYFEDDFQSMFDPVSNLKLGISYDYYLYNYYDGDIFNALAAYNCGMGNVDKGRDWGDEYARDILAYTQILIDNPEFTQMLLNRELDMHSDEILIPTGEQ